MDSGWIYEPTPQHRCLKPRIGNHFVGAIWKCGKCHQAWVVSAVLQNGIVRRKEFAPILDRNVAEILATVDSRTSVTQRD